VADVAKAQASAPKSVSALPDSSDRDQDWVARLVGQDKVDYFTARLEWAKADARFEAEEAKAREAKEKPGKDFENLQNQYRAAVEAKRKAMEDAAAKGEGIRKAATALRAGEADNPEKVTAQLAALRAATDDYDKATKGVAATVAAVDASDAALRKFAEPQPGVAADQLKLDKDTQAIAEHQYELAVATARDPLDKASIDFNEKRAALFPKRRKA
jgi:hypothetical protein